MLAFGEPNYKDLIQKTTLEAVTSNTITKNTKLISEIEQIKKIGFALDMEENEVGLICVAVPVFNRNNEFIAAISNSGPTARFNESKIQNYTDVLKETANKLKLIFN